MLAGVLKRQGQRPTVSAFCSWHKEQGVNSDSWKFLRAEILWLRQGGGGSLRGTVKLGKTRYAKFLLQIIEPLY
jgi:hypothetical protein